MQVRASGGPFVAEDLPREQARLQAREIVGAGPIFGPKMLPAQQAVGAAEARLLADADLQIADFARHKKLLQGTRRANLVFFDDLQVEASTQDASLTLQVDLPPGSYATVLLHELGATVGRAPPAAPYG